MTNVLFTLSAEAEAGAEAGIATLVEEARVLAEAVVGAAMLKLKISQSKRILQLIL